MLCNMHDEVHAITPCQSNQACFELEPHARL
jgi:hypothetical protein